MIHTANFAALFGRVANAQLLALMRPKPVGYCKTGVNGSDVDTIRAACERQARILRRCCTSYVLRVRAFRPTVINVSYEKHI
jgi:hypothetical protein